MLRLSDTYIIDSSGNWLSSIGTGLQVNMSAARTPRDQHKRLAKMLGCLVASMTLGAAFLDWFQPNQPESETPRRQLIAQIRNAIHPSAEGSVPAEKWQVIRAVAAVAGDDTRVHFVVDRNGDWAPTPHWQNQKTIGESGVIRIGLRTEGQSGEITIPQWKAACQLRSNLQEMYRITLERFILSPSLRLPAEPKDASVLR